MNLAHIVGYQADIGRAAVLAPEGVCRQTVVQRADAPDALLQPPIRRTGPLPKSNDRKPGEAGAGGRKRSRRSGGPCGAIRLLLLPLLADRQTAEPAFGKPRDPFPRGLDWARISALLQHGVSQPLALVAKVALRLAGIAAE
uniref:hypothetical protein n=1 Tax=Rhizobium laguerreae TaxID=1076926 RepID=UPI001C907046